MKFNPIRRVTKWQAIVAVVCFATGVASSHEMWIQGSKSIVEPGTEVSLNLYVGTKFKGDDKPYNPSAFQHYRVATSTATVPITGHYGDIPAGRVKAVSPGLNIVSYHSQPFQIQFKEADKWQRYLEYEGLDEVAQHYRQNGFPQSGLRETYQRCARALIWGVPPSATSLAKADQQDRPSNMPLELISLDNPFTIASDMLKLQLLYLADPIANIQVRVFYRAAGQKDRVVEKIARTDQHGTVTLPRFGPGDYLFNAVHLVPPPPGHQAEWQSYWASLTFTLE